MSLRLLVLCASLDAFVDWMALAQKATETLDLQYYIWHRDITGLLLFEAMLDAADRGVRVRLLIDDFNTAGLDPTLAALDAHERIEVRLFNPFVHREQRWLSCTRYVYCPTRACRPLQSGSHQADDSPSLRSQKTIRPPLRARTTTLSQTVLPWYLTAKSRANA